VSAAVPNRHVPRAHGDASLTVLHPFRCTVQTCRREWCVTAPIDQLVLPGPCLFCGLLRVEALPATVLLPGGLEAPLWGRTRRRLA